MPFNSAVASDHSCPPCRIELDQYKEESDSEQESEAEEAWEEVARPRRSHHHWQNRSGTLHFFYVFFYILFTYGHSLSNHQCTLQIVSTEEGTFNFWAHEKSHEKIIKSKVPLVPALPQIRDFQECFLVVLEGFSRSVKLNLWPMHTSDH